MNIWIEYWEKSKEPSKNTHAQIREQANWVPPDPKQFVKDSVKVEKMLTDMQIVCKNKVIM